ncbi:hypothetical protein GCM10022222_84350 [Amycolatopsis ultiminotia]|uniref:Uncharacterized protein n=1 Tax=Amycolatopsis ultiminotia TaxID=543629 RepID=A0ABP6YMN4_9PSEU
MATTPSTATDDVAFARAYALITNGLNAHPIATEVPHRCQPVCVQLYTIPAPTSVEHHSTIEPSDESRSGATTGNDDA